MRRIGLACAALVVLCACGRAPSPIEPTATANASPKAPSSPPNHRTNLEPPKLPEVAKQNDATGAANFVLYWVKVSNYAALTGDTELLREISSSDCEGCNRYISLYEETYAGGGSFEGGNRRLADVETLSDDAGTYVSAKLIAEPGFFKPSSAALKKRSPAESTNVTFLARFDGASWAMADVGLTDT